MSSAWTVRLLYAGTAAQILNAFSCSVEQLSRVASLLDVL